MLLFGSMVPALLLLFFYTNQLQESLHTTIEEKTEQVGIKVVHSDLDFLIADFKSKVIALAKEEFLIGLMDTGENAIKNLKQLVDYRKRTTASKAITIYNYQGIIMASSNEATSKNLNMHEVDRIESKKEEIIPVVSFFSIEKGRSFRLDVYVPVIEPFYKYLQGIVKETIFVDEVFIQKIKQKTGFEVALFYEGIPLIHTSEAPPVLDSSIFSKLVQTKKVVVQNTLLLNDISYHMALQPVVNEDGTVFGAIGIFASEEVIEKNLKLAKKISIITVLGIIAFSLGVNFYSAKKLTGPILKVVKALRKIANRELSQRIKVNDQNEIGELVQSLNIMAEDLQKTTVSRDYVDNILGSMIDTMIVAGPDGRIRTVNKATQELLGFKEEELIGKPIKNFIGDYIAQDSKNLNLSDNMFVSSYETVYRTKEGNFIPVLCSCAVMKNKNGAYEGIVLVSKDISQLKQAEISLRNKAKLVSLGELAGGVAHEIRTCLGGMMNYSTRIIVNIKNKDQTTRQIKNLQQNLSECLAKQKYDKLPALKKELDALFTQANKYEERLRKNSKGINEMGLRGIKITSDLLAFSKKRPPQMKPTKIYDLIEYILEIVRSDFEKSHIEFSTEYEPGLPPVNIDEDQIKQVILNFLLNAKNAINGTGKIRIRAGLAPSKNFLEILVSDTGRGIPDGEMDKIFDPFFTTSEKGTGLGLSISYGIIQNHMGKISVESKVGKGSTFKIHLPLDLDSAK